MRQISAVLIATLLSIRSRIDKNELRGIDNKATTQKKLTSALIAGQIIDTLIQTRLAGAVSSIEAFSQSNNLQMRGVEALSRIFQRKLKKTMMVLSKADDALMGVGGTSFLAGYMVIDRFLLVRNLQLKYSFFNEGRRLFEEDRARIPSSARKAKMIKSPSLVVEVTQNFRYGFLEINQLVEKKLLAVFK